MPQTSYSQYPNASSAGTIGFTNDYTAFSYTNPNSAMQAGQGVVLIAGTPKQCNLPSGSSDILIGAIMRDASQPAAGLPSDPNSDPFVTTNYPINSEIAVMSRGQLQVLVNQAVTVGDAVYLNYKLIDQVQTIVFSADLITSNSVAGTVNGTALTATVFASSNAATLTALAAKIAAISGVKSAVSDGTHTITVTANDDTDVALTGFAVTLGVSQAGVAVSETITKTLSTDIGSFRKDDGTSKGGAACAFIVSRCRWLEASVTDIKGKLTCMLDIQLP